MREFVLFHLPRVANVFLGAAIGLFVGCLFGIAHLLWKEPESLLPFVLSTILGAVTGGLAAAFKGKIQRLFPGAGSVEGEKNPVLSTSGWEG